MDRDRLFSLNIDRRNREWIAARVLRILDPKPGSHDRFHRHVLQQELLKLGLRQQGGIHHELLAQITRLDAANQGAECLAHIITQFLDGGGRVNELASIVKEGRVALARGLPTVLATVVAVRGSAYRRPGARMLVTSEGWRAGSISGGCLEADVTRQAAFLVANGRALVRSYDTSEDAGARLGCGGEIDVLLEPLDAAFLEMLAAERNAAGNTLAATKVELVLAAARRAGHPLQCILETA